MPGGRADCASIRAAFARPCGPAASMQIHEHILETLGDTPLVRLLRFHPSGAALAPKVESFNPCGSVKDRIGTAMIEAGDRAGLLPPGGTIVHPTSGNPGV